MNENFRLIDPNFIPPFDDKFRPAALANKFFREKVQADGVPLIIGLEREDGKLSRFGTLVYPEDHPQAPQNFFYIERLVKFLLWQRGGYRLFIGGSKPIGEYIRKTYSANGERKFDFHFMGDQVYEKEFQVLPCEPHEVPPENESGQKIGGDFTGHRIGFDLGASDRKVSAVVDGEVIYSEEEIWEPTKQTNIQYHYSEIMDSLQRAASKIDQVNAIGGSSAGIFINNQPRVASLFRGIPKEQRFEVKNLFNKIQTELGVPLIVINDGDVTALAGAMALDDTGILGIALGSSEAGGYVDMQGHIMGWLNELSFVPIDYSPNGAIDEWSGDRGCGASYLSQQCIFRLAPLADIHVSNDLPNAEKLVYIQEKLEQGHAGAINIWKTMGIYLGYAIAHYAEFYEIKHVIILGRCTSGSGGSILVKQAEKVISHEFPNFPGAIKIQLPDEKQRRLGQAIVAASLPNL